MCRIEPLLPRHPVERSLPRRNTAKCVPSINHTRANADQELLEWTRPLTAFCCHYRTRANASAGTRRLVSSEASAIGCSRWHPAFERLGHYTGRVPARPTVTLIWWICVGYGGYVGYVHYIHYTHTSEI